MRSCKSFAIRSILLAVTVAWLSSPLVAQTTGTIFGTVSDASGAVVPGAEVRAKNLGTEVERTATTNAEGVYQVPSLPPGPYEVSVRASGFKTYTQSGIRLQLGENVQVKVNLEVGQLTETVTVEADAVRVDTQSTTVGATMDNRRLTAIPLNGRNVYALAQLLPGVGAGSNLGASNPGGARAGATLSISGNNDYTNNVLLDGTSMVSNMYNAAVPIPNPDALQEFRVLTNTFGADLGKASGGVITAVTKSGTNELHGSLFEFLRNDNLNASNFFFPGQVPKLSQNQFGGSLGGPVVKNKTFLFGAYQGLEIREQRSTTYFSPTQAQRGGDLSSSSAPVIDPDTGQPFQNNQIPSSRFDPLTINVMKEYIDLPNRPGGQFSTLFAVPTSGNELVIKGDQYVGSSDRFSLRYFRKHDEVVGLGSQVIKLQGSQFVNTNTAVLNHTHIFNPELLVESRLSYFHYAPTWATSPFAKTPKELGGNYNQDSPIPHAPNFEMVGLVSTSSQRAFSEPDATWDMGSKASWIRGRHSMRFGFEYRRMRHLTRVHEWGGQAAFNGAFTGNAVGDYLIGRTQTLGLRSIGEDESLGYQWHGFIQDDFKITRHLTLNLGLRYELFQPWENRRDEIAIFKFNSWPTSPQDAAPLPRSTIFPTAPPGLLYPGDAGVPRGLYSGDKNNFAPRLGIAWDPFGTGRTVIRVAYGIFNISPQAVLAAEIQQNVQPYRRNFNIINPLRVSDPYKGAPDPLPFDRSTARTDPRFIYPQAGLHFLDPNYSDAYVQQYNLNIQHQFGADLLFQIGYVGHAGRKLFTRANELNQPRWGPGLNAGNLQSHRPFLPEFYTTIQWHASALNSSYNSLQLNVEKRFANNYTAQVAYTYSRTLDHESAYLTPTNFRQGTFGPQDGLTNYGLEWGPAGYHQKHILAVNGIWEIPLFKDQQGVAAAVLGGWQLSGRARVTSGFPVTVRMGSDVRFRGGFFAQDRPDLIADPVLDHNRPRGEQVAQYFNTKAYVPNSGATVNGIKGIPGREGLAGLASRGQIEGPGLALTDVAVRKLFSLGEPFGRIELRGEIFNLFNQVNFNGPEPVFISPAFGRLLSAQDPRIVQFGLRWDF